MTGCVGCCEQAHALAPSHPGGVMCSSDARDSRSQECQALGRTNSTRRPRSQVPSHSCFPRGLLAYTHHKRPLCAFSPSLTLTPLPQPVPAFTFPQSGRDSAKRVFISKLHSKGTGESISGVPGKSAALRVVLAGLNDPWPSVLIWMSAMSSGTGAVQLQP